MANGTNGTRYWRRWTTFLYVFRTYHLIAIPIRPSTHKRIWRVVCVSLWRTFCSVSSWNIRLILLETPAADDTNEAFYKVHVTNHFTHSWLWNQNAIQDENRLSIFVGILFPAIMSFYCLAIECQSRATNETENCNKRNRPQTRDVILESFVALVFKYLLYALARARSNALRIYIYIIHFLNIKVNFFSARSTCRQLYAYPN